MSPQNILHMIRYDLSYKYNKYNNYINIYKYNNNNSSYKEFYITF